jgi:hypothetical protein
VRPFLPKPDPGCPLDLSIIDMSLYPLGFPKIGEVWEIGWGYMDRRVLLILSMYNEWHWECLDLEDGSTRYPSVEAWIKRNISSYKPLRML